MTNRSRASNKRRQSKKATKSMVGGAVAINRAPYPPRWRRKIVYTITARMTEGAAGTGSIIVFRANDLYDPYYAAGGLQPMYFDQLCSATGPYTKFRVFGARVDFTVSSLANTVAMFGVYFSPSPTSPASYVEAQEKPFGRSSLIGQGSGGVTRSLSSFATTHAVLGLAPSHVANDDYYAGAYNASPINQDYIVVWQYGTSATVADLAYTVRITYDAEFFGYTNTGVS